MHHQSVGRGNGAIVEPKLENGLVVGNTYNKYESPNAVSKYLIGGFFRSFDRLLAKADTTRVTEVGCGEGYLARHLARRGMSVVASDVSAQMIAEAERESAGEGLEIEYHLADIYELDPAVHRNDLVVCCEVLEHLREPERALKKLVEIADRFLILSVPREPVWRVLNLCRLRYVRDFGNTPGHLQHWSPSEFLRLAARFADPVAIDWPFPWTMVLLSTRRGQR